MNLRWMTYSFVGYRIFVLSTSFFLSRKHVWSQKTEDGFVTIIITAKNNNRGESRVTDLFPVSFFTYRTFSLELLLTKTKEITWYFKKYNQEVKYQINKYRNCDNNIFSINNIYVSISIYSNKQKYSSLVY